jgi:two-component system OmpR family sensor kinase/two-component system sensor histidine kinase BaeS
MSRWKGWKDVRHFDHDDWRGGRRWRRGGGRRWLFARFAGMFGLMALLVVGGMAALAFLITRLFGAGGQVALLVWIAGCGLSLTLPSLAAILAARAFRGIAAPLADVMEAADAVAGGDLSARVREDVPNPFRRLAKSFNRMTHELERADHQRRNLTADVAHELRTPLHVIQGNLEGIVDGVYEPDEKHVNSILDETRLLNRLVDDLHTLALAEAGQLSMAHDIVNVQSLLEDVVTSFSGQAEAAGIDVRAMSHSETNALTVRGDDKRLYQVLSNLVVNALRHTSRGGTITLEAERDDGAVRIVVRDTGEGIPAEDLPHIFDRFWRGDRSRSHTDGSGAGLGLAIARQLVEAHGGSIEAHSQVGQGTTFTLHLPAG